MKLAALNNKTLDGELIIVSNDLKFYTKPSRDIPTLQAAMDDWDNCEPILQSIADELESSGNGIPFDQSMVLSPLPRSYQWADGSAYLNHVELVRKARNAKVPETFFTDPLMYQGGSDSFATPRGPIETLEESWGIDLEAEVAVIVSKVPMGISAKEAVGYIKMVMLVNDVTLRNLTPSELSKGFGFFQSKPATAFSPVAVTVNSLENWEQSKMKLPLCVDVNNKPFGRANAGIDMTFSFAELIAHAAKTRELASGTIIGSGTISNKFNDGPGKPIENGGVGYSCISEIRVVETILHGEPKTPYLKFGDSVKIWMDDSKGNSIFGSIDQTVKKYRRER